MFLTIESARLPCCTTFSRLPRQHAGQFGHLGALFVTDLDACDDLLQFVDQLGGKRGEVVDEIQRILDLVRDARCELAERGKLLGLDQAVLRGAQLGERAFEVVGARAQFGQEPCVLDGDHRLVAE